jgi:fructuronate reductase
MSRLTDSSLAGLPATIRRPAYDRAATGIGIVHIGPGAFHRAHQASYIDSLLEGGGDWALSAIALNSRDITDALPPQQGLYTLATLGERAEYRVIGAVREVLHAPSSRAAVLARLANPSTRIVTCTVTEKGYCLNGAGLLDADHPAIRADLASPQTPTSLIGWLVEGLRLRHIAGLPPFTVVSCDNLSGNGHKLGRALVDFTDRLDPALARWIEAEGAFPCTMVDSITPATDEALKANVAAALGVADAAPVQREPFTQWVVEDRFCNGRPAFESVGVQMTHDVAAFERAKLRLLNGPHSSLAYLGLLLGLESVADAVTHPLLSRFVERLMRDDIAPTVPAPAGFDLNQYIGDILARFANPGIRHLLAQIAWDGSQKLPVRLLGTIADALAAGRAVDALCLPVAGWLHFLRQRAQTGQPKLVDPLAERLLAIATGTTGHASADVAAFLALESVFPPALVADARFRDALEKAYTSLSPGNAGAVARALGA